MANRHLHNCGIVRDSVQFVCKPYSKMKQVQPTRHRGFAAIGLHLPKTPANIGGSLRSAYCYGAAMVAVAGSRYSGHSTDTPKAYRHIPLLKVDDLHSVIPHDCVPVAVDLIDGATPLHKFKHPQRAFYIFGPEDGTLGAEITGYCKFTVYVPTFECMNLASAVTTVLYDRQAKALRNQELKLTKG